MKQINMYLNNIKSPINKRVPKIKEYKNTIIIKVSKISQGM